MRKNGARASALCKVAGFAARGLTRYDLNGSKQASSTYVIPNGWKYSTDSLCSGIQSWTIKANQRCIRRIENIRQQLTWESESAQRDMSKNDTPKFFPRYKKFCQFVDAISMTFRCHIKLDLEYSYRNSLYSEFLDCGWNDLQSVLKHFLSQIYDRPEHFHLRSGTNSQGNGWSKIAITIWKLRE